MHQKLCLVFRPFRSRSKQCEKVRTILGTKYHYLVVLWWSFGCCSGSSTRSWCLFTWRKIHWKILQCLQKWYMSIGTRSCLTPTTIYCSIIEVANSFSKIFDLTSSWGRVFGKPIDRILCYRFSLNPRRFSLMRETSSKMTSAKSWTICKLQFLNDIIDQNNIFAKLPSDKQLIVYNFTRYLQLLSIWL